MRKYLVVSDLNYLLKQNRAWAQQMSEDDPHFFSDLSKQQHPKYLWIGCADSRVPETQIIQQRPGDIFVHRNVANVVVHSDLNCLSVIQYAVEVLEVEHIIVCGHYGCGGVDAAMHCREHGLIDNWLRFLKDIYHEHQVELDSIPDETQRLRRFCELNVIHQVNNVCHTTIVQRAWDKGQALAVHGWIYGLDDGIIHDLHHEINSPDKLEVIYQIVRKQQIR
ncbi:MAG: carbonate dehydratase [Chloroflexota bacterium]